MPLHGNINSWIFQNNNPAIFGGDTELNTLANAASIVNETDALTGFTVYAATEAESQSAVKAVGSSYSILVNLNNTPVAVGRIYLDMQADPFSFVDGESGILTMEIRHIGIGDSWGAYLAVASNSNTHTIGTVGITETTFKTISIEWTHDATYRWLTIRENNAPNTGGVYVDRLSVKKG